MVHQGKNLQRKNFWVKLHILKPKAAQNWSLNILQSLKKKLIVLQYFKNNHFPCLGKDEFAYT